MKDKPLITILMAARDTAPYLNECLDSILAQTYPYWELIAINDHSIDATPQILEEYAKKDARIRIIHSEREKLIPSLKEGYTHARGELINRMDSDDRMPNNKLELLITEWIKHGKGTIVAGGTKHFVSQGQVGGGFIRYEGWLNEVARKSLYYNEIYRECVIPSHCWLIHREDFDLVGGFEPEVYPEDYDLCFRFYKHRLKIVGIDHILHYWRDRDDRISRTWTEYKDNRYFELKLKYFYELDRDKNRPLVVWGVGRNGKDLVKQILNYEKKIYWVGENPKKIGQIIFKHKILHPNNIVTLPNPQVIIVVASDSDKLDIISSLQKMQKRTPHDYFLFL